MPNPVQIYEGHQETDECYLNINPANEQGITIVLDKARVRLSVEYKGRRT